MDDVFRMELVGDDDENLVNMRRRPKPSDYIDSFNKSQNSSTLQVSPQNKAKDMDRESCKF